MNIAGLTIRPATLADAPELGEVHAAAWKWCYRGVMDQAFLDSLNGPMFEKYHRPAFDEATGRLKGPSMPFFIAREGDGGRIIGFIKGGSTRAAAPTGDKLPLDMPARFSAELYAIYLLPDCVGRGAGSALLAAWLEAIAALGHQSLCVWVLSENRRGRAFYERCAGELVSGSEHPLTLGGKAYLELAYGWPDITRLRRALSRP